MDQPVVWPAEQDEVAEGGLAPVCPVPDVVRIAPARRAAAAGEPAAAIADGDSSPQGRRHHLAGPPDVERL
jgi:hypothetical protein